MSRKDPKIYLQDIVDSIEKIEKYTKDLTTLLFEEDEKTVDAVVRNLEIIGEAANNVPQDIRDKYADIPWREMVSMRNKVLHEYFGVDTEILWETIQEDLPDLKKNVEIVLDHLNKT